MTESLSMSNVFLGMLFLIFSIIGGFWSHQNVSERYSKNPSSKLRVFISFAPTSILFGALSATHFGIDPYWGILFGGIPFSISGKFEEFSRRQLRKGDGPTLEYFMRMAQSDGNEMKNKFSKKLLIVAEQNRLDELTVDVVIQAYAETRADLGLPPVTIDEKDIPFI